MVIIANITINRPVTAPMACIDVISMHSFFLSSLLLVHRTVVITIVDVFVIVVALFQIEQDVGIVLILVLTLLSVAPVGECVGGSAFISEGVCVGHTVTVAGVHIVCDISKGSVVLFDASCLYSVVVDSCVE